MDSQTLFRQWPLSPKRQIALLLFILGAIILFDYSVYYFRDFLIENYSQYLMRFIHLPEWEII